MSQLDRRQREINQLKRRYGNSLQQDPASHSFSVPFTPTDPDFPYELPELFVTLSVPLDYPQQPAILRIKSGLEVGYARNIEREFEQGDVGLGYAGRGILGMLSWLDRNLERILAMKKSDTVKLIRPAQNLPTVVNNPVETEVSRAPMPSMYTFTELEDAKSKRLSELTKLRMIHPSRFDQDSFDLDITESLRIRLQVPLTFPLVSAWLIVLKGDEAIEDNANKELRESTRGLARTLNWIGANLKKLQKREDSANIAGTSISVTQDEKIWRPEDDGFVPVPGHQYSVQLR